MSINTTPDQRLHDAKIAYAAALAAYMSPTGRASAKQIDHKMRSDLSTLVRMCHARGIRLPEYFGR